MADQTIELVVNRTKEKLQNLKFLDVASFEIKKNEAWNSTCEELAKEMTDQGLNNTAQAILSLKVNH